MCIIAAKPAGVKMPDATTIENMWYANNDGAGLMYAKDGKVKIEKGFMTLKALTAALERIREDTDLDATGVVMHFRITTHGGTRPENTHPFPVTDNVKMLQRLTCSTNLGVAHNGIISTVTPREKDISDTMEYTAAVLSPLKRMNPAFPSDPAALDLIRNTICGSRMAFLDGTGAITTVGTWEIHDGISYSNSSYKGWSNYRGLYGYTRWDDYGTPWGDDCAFTSYVKKTAKTGTGKKKGKSKNVPKSYSCTQKNLMFLLDTDSDAIVQNENGLLFDSCDYLIDANGYVYLYDPTVDAAYPCPRYRAYDHEFKTPKFEPDLAAMTFVINEDITT